MARGHATAGSCGAGRTGGDTFATFRVRRTQAGILPNHHRYIRYQLNYTARRAFRSNASFTSVFATYDSARTHRTSFEENDTNMKLGRRNLKRYYAHTSVTVTPGSEILFSGNIKFSPPYQIAPRTYLHGDKYEGDCVAR